MNLPSLCKISVLAAAHCELDKITLAIAKVIYGIQSIKVLGLDPSSGHALDRSFF